MVTDGGTKLTGSGYETLRGRVDKVKTSQAYLTRCTTSDKSAVAITAQIEFWAILSTERKLRRRLVTAEPTPVIEGDHVIVEYRASSNGILRFEDLKKVWNGIIADISE